MRVPLNYLLWSPNHFPPQTISHFPHFLNFPPKLNVPSKLPPRNWGSPTPGPETPLFGAAFWPREVRESAVLPGGLRALPDLRRACGGDLQEGGHHREAGGRVNCHFSGPFLGVLFLCVCVCFCFGGALGSLSFFFFGRGASLVGFECFLFFLFGGGGGGGVGVWGLGFGGVRCASFLLVWGGRLGFRGAAGWSRGPWNHQKDHGPMAGPLVDLWVFVGGGVLGGGGWDSGGWLGAKGRPKLQFQEISSPNPTFFLWARGFLGDSRLALRNCRPPVTGWGLGGFGGLVVWGFGGLGVWVFGCLGKTSNQ